MLDTVIFLAAAAALPLVEQAYQSTLLAKDQQSLTIKGGGKNMLAPMTEAEQQGFSQVQLSSDGKKVGWLALTRNCCTSYPLPTALLIFSHGKVVQRFTLAPPIWQWQFMPDNKTVAYQQAYPHGLSPIVYTLARIADGKPLATFSCLPDETKTGPDAPYYKMSGPIPGWVKKIAHECPPADDEKKKED